MTPAEKEKFLNSPALQPPEGGQPNFSNPSSLHFIGPGIVQLALVTLFVAVRLYAKIRIVRRVLIEDYVLFLAHYARVHSTLSCFFSMSFLWVCINGIWYNSFLLYGISADAKFVTQTMRHLIKHDRLYSLLKYAYTAVIIPLKVAIILQILRIFAPLGRATNASIFWLAHLFLWANIILYGSNFVVQITSCRPIARGWDPTVQGSCAKRRYTHVFTASINTASDIVLLLLPLPGVWKLKLDKLRTRWMLRAVFLFGICACIATVIRLYYSVTYQHSADMTYQAALVARWAEAELTCGFIVACLPYLPNVMKHVTTNLRSLRSTKISEASAAQQDEIPKRINDKTEVSITQNEV